MAFFARIFRKKILLALAASFLCLGAGGALWLWHSVPDPLAEALSWPVSPVLLDSGGNMIHARLSEREEWCLPVPLSEMGEWLPKVLVAVEDKRFYTHGGVDMLALSRAVVQNLGAGRVRSGASTITSQLVRLSTPRSRTMSTKVMEFVGAWKLERSLSKKQILELYLNRAPFGGPIRGVEAAARMYFGKRAKELSLGEAALLVGLLKGPTAYRPDRNPRAALKRRQQIIAKVAEQSGFPSDMTALALAEPLPEFRPVMPAGAWHFASIAFKTLPREGGIVRSSLDMRAQALLERVLKAQLRGVDEEITAAGIVVDNATASVVAYVGNARFDPVQRVHWVDCGIAPRSPGSTLKPFVYLAAVEKGHIIPASLLADTPLRLGGEAPRNYDMRFRGPVSAHTALSDSLNVPAVRVLRMVGVRQALARLRNAGFAHVSRKDEDYGDSLVLGAGEVTLLELARAYSTLARLGEDRQLFMTVPEGAGIKRVWEAQEPHALAKPLPELLPPGLAPAYLQRRRQQGAVPDAPRELYSRAASYLIADVLKDPGRLPFLVQLMRSEDNRPVAFKTGTSYGLRDAWTAAYTPSHTVVVWFGKASGAADPRLVGISMAAPAAVRVLRELAANAKDATPWFEQPQDVGRVRVCTLSGAAASPYCPATRETLNIPQVWRTVPCSMHVLRDGKVTLVWPDELEDFHKKRLSQEDLSRHVLITSPFPGTRYLITPGARSQPIGLKAEGVSYPVHWYVDGEYLGEQERADLPLYWQPTGGTHSISLLDAKERIGKAQVAITDLSEQAGTLPLLGE